MKIFNSINVKDKNHNELKESTLKSRGDTLIPYR